jgi:hypothetical protein
MRFLRLSDTSVDCVWGKSGNRGESLDAYSRIDVFVLIVWVVTDYLKRKGE